MAEVFKGKEHKCPVCEKVFIMAPKHLYKLNVNGKVQNYCSYTCYRKIQKRQERGKKKHRRM